MKWGENLDLKRQIEVLSQEIPTIPDVELVPDNARARDEGDEEVDWILAKHEKEKESQKKQDRV